VAANSQSLPQELTSHFRHGSSDAQASRNSSRRQAGGIAAKIVWRPHGDSFQLPACRWRVRTSSPEPSGAVNTPASMIVVQLARVTSGHHGHSKSPSCLVSGITGRDLSDSQTDSAGRRDRPVGMRAERAITLARSVRTWDMSRLKCRKSVPVLCCLWRGLGLKDGPGSARADRCQCLAEAGDSPSRHRPGRVLADLAPRAKVVQTVVCSTFTRGAKPATRRVADGERMNPQGRVARSRQ
jgi:hypothetical protein